LEIGTKNAFTEAEVGEWKHELSISLSKNRIQVETDADAKIVVSFDDKHAPCHEEIIDKIILEVHATTTPGD